MARQNAGLLVPKSGIRQQSVNACAQDFAKELICLSRPLAWWPHLWLCGWPARGDLEGLHERRLLLGETATRITKGGNRVVDDATSKPPGTIEWEW